MLLKTLYNVLPSKATSIETKIPSKSQLDN